MPSFPCVPALLEEGWVLGGRKHSNAVELLRSAAVHQMWGFVLVSKWIRFLFRHKRKIVVTCLSSAPLRSGQFQSPHSTLPVDLQKKRPSRPRSLCLLRRSRLSFITPDDAHPSEPTTAPGTSTWTSIYASRRKSPAHPRPPTPQKLPTQPAPRQRYQTLVLPARGRRGRRPRAYQQPGPSSRTRRSG